MPEAPFHAHDEVAVRGGAQVVACGGLPPDETDAAILALVTFSLMPRQSVARDLAGRTQLCLLASDFVGADSAPPPAQVLEEVSGNRPVSVPSAIVCEWELPASKAALR